MLGPGKYDDLCTHVRESTRAEGTILIVLGGTRGSGFSAQLTPIALLAIPRMLRDVADQIESSVADDTRNIMSAADDVQTVRKEPNGQETRRPEGE